MLGNQGCPPGTSCLKCKQSWSNLFEGRRWNTERSWSPQTRSYISHVRPAQQSPQIHEQEAQASLEEVPACRAQTVSLRTCGLSGCFLRSESSKLVYYTADLTDTYCQSPLLWLGGSFVSLLYCLTFVYFLHTYPPLRLNKELHQHSLLTSADHCWNSMISSQARHIVVVQYTLVKSISSWIRKSDLVSSPSFPSVALSFSLVKWLNLSLNLPMPPLPNCKTGLMIVLESPGGIKEVMCAAS